MTRDNDKPVSRQDALAADIDLMRDVYMSRAQREAYDRIVAAALLSGGGDAEEKN